MIASHLLAYFFTELNHDQVQKVRKRGAGAAGLACGKVVWFPRPRSPGSRPKLSFTLPGHSSPRFGASRRPGNSWASGATSASPGQAGARVLGRGLARAPLSLPAALRALPLFFSFLFFSGGAGRSASSLRLMGPRGRCPSFAA